MPTENKTPNINLNNWLSTDKPKRQDFVDDNMTLDAVIGNHLADAAVHMSTAEKALLNAPFEVGIIAGDGTSSCNHTLSFSPKLVLVFLRDKVLIEYNATNAQYIYNFCIATQSVYGSTKGATLSGSTLTLEQTQSQTAKEFINLNKYFGQYVYIAFK